MFRLPKGRVGIVMGDVVGHGLAAAIVMGRLRSALRAYALEHDDPAEVLRRLDRKISFFEEGAMATVLYAIIDPPYDRVRVSTAGHLPPILAEPGKAARIVELRPDLPLGVEASHDRRAVCLALPPGSALCLFTDGLVERRPVPPARFEGIDPGLDRIAEVFDAGDAATSCTAVLAAALDERAADDDIALLVVHRTGGDGA